MRLQRQLTLLLVLVAVIPVLVSGGTGAWLTWESLGEAQAARLAAQARTVAEHADLYVTNALTDLRLSTAALQLQGLTADERQGALNLIYRQNERFNVVALVGEEGDGVGDPVLLSGPADDPELRGREVLSEADLAEFSSHVPLAAALRAGAALGPPYSTPVRHHPLIVLAVAVQLDKARRGVLAVELSLAPLQRRLNETAITADGIAFLVDSTARSFAAAKAEGPATVDPAAPPPEVLAALAPGTLDKTSGSRWLAWADADMLAGHAQLDRLPWTAVVAQDGEVALAPVVRMLGQTGFWLVVALLCAVLAGSVLARAVSNPVEDLVGATQAFERGEFATRVPPLSVPDLQRLGDAFNRMAAEVQRRDEELRAFNAELQKRVDERTRDLKEAQDQLIQSQKLAAVGELGAGVAHEINNPLAGLLGLIQLQMLRGREGDPALVALRDMEKEALRIRDIVQNLMQLTPQKGSGEQLLDVNRVVEAALNLVARPIVAQRIEVKKDLEPNLPKVRGKTSELQQAVLALLSNARNAMPDGGVLTLSTRGVDGKLVKLTVADTGRGIAEDIRDRIFEPFFTTKPVPDAKGLGLALVHRVVQDHGARVSVDSEPGKGAAFTITMPAAREKMHLV
ncbi:MAG: HAMP domain-containing protein [Deltaproteobacteria bacterium]|nr:HAMP domain-containing protein [Deltaproteobacteria bacterium]